MSRTRADVLLVRRGLFESRGKARDAVEAGGVTADGRVILKASELVDDDAAIEAVAAFAWVGRGALKLEAALAAWPIPVAGRTVLDVGASTGGFTEVCLARGAQRVFAVDVGRGQLHPRLAADPRVADLQAVDARDLTAQLIPDAPQLVVSDVSFIGLAKALPAALELAASGADLVALVKPQFEVGPGDVGRGGIVREEAARQRALTEVKAFVTAAGWTVRDAVESPVAGRDGNREFLLWATKKPSAG